MSKLRFLEMSWPLGTGVRATLDTPYSPNGASLELKINDKIYDINLACFSCKT